MLGYDSDTMTQIPVPAAITSPQSLFPPEAEGNVSSFHDDILDGIEVFVIHHAVIIHIGRLLV